MNAYSWSYFTGTFTDIQSTGTQFTYTNTGTGYATIALPFSFPYDGTVIASGTNITVGANGAISLSSVVDSNGPVLGNSRFPGMLCIFSGDMVVGDRGLNFDHYRVTGTSPNRVLTIQYHGIHFPGAGTGGGGGGGTGGGTGAPTTKMQVKLYETSGIIEFLYLDHSYEFGKTLGPAGIGLNGFATPVFEYISFANRVTATPSTDIRWTPSTFGSAPAVTFSSTDLFRNVHTVLRDSSTRYIRVTSNGTAPLVINNVSISGAHQSDYFISRLPNYPIAVGSTDSIGITFTPTVEGLEDAVLAITTTADNNPNDSVALRGIGTLPRITVTLPGGGTSIHFDSIGLGDKNCKALLVENPGTDTLRITGQYLDGDYDFTLSTLSPIEAVIPPGETRVMNICFYPLRDGTRYTTIRLFTNIPKTFDTTPADTGHVFINVNGIGLFAGKLSIYGPVADTAIVGGRTHCIVDTIVNTSPADFTVVEWRLTGTRSSEFSVSGITLPRTLHSGDTLRVQFCFTPTASGANSDSLLLIGNASGRPITVTVPIVGIGIAVCATAPHMLLIGHDNLTLIGTTDTALVTVQNCGDIPATYTAHDLQHSSITLLSPKTIGPIAPAGTATFRVTYTASRVSVQTDTLEITTADNSLAIAVPTRAEGAGVIASAIASGLQVAQGTCRDFEITITNSGNYPWLPGMPAIGGAQAADFTYVSGPTPDTIMPGATAKVTVRFCPKTVGLEEMTLAFPQSMPSPIGGFSYDFTAVGEVNAVENQASQTGYSLGQSYPNPAVGAAQLTVTIPHTSLVTLEVLDARGVHVRSLHSGSLTAGEHTFTLDVKDLPSGAYFLEMQCGDIHLVRSLVVSK